MDSLTSAGGRRGGLVPGWLKIRDDAPLLPNFTAPAFVIEQYRTLAVQIEQHMEGLRGGFALVVTSPEKGTGKTLTSLNLALSLAHGGERRALLLDGDLYHPAVQGYFRPERSEPGFHQLLEGTVELDRAAVPIHEVGLDVVPAGARGLGGNAIPIKRLDAVLAQMRERYEIVVVDAPPLPGMASARTLVGRGDGVLLVVRARQSRKPDIEEALSIVGPEKVVGMVFNAARVSRSSYYY